MNEAQLRNLTFEERARWDLPITYDQVEVEIEGTEYAVRCEAADDIEDAEDVGYSKLEHEILVLLDDYPDPAEFVDELKMHLEASRL